MTVVRARVREPFADRRRPQPGDDRQLLLEPVEALLHVRERDAVGPVLAVEPARTQPELDAAAAHLVDARHGDRERAGAPEGGRGDQGAEPDRGGVAGQAGQRHPGVRRAGQAVGAQGEVVVGAEERAEPEPLGRLGHGEEVVVRRALLGLGEDPEVHAATLGAGSVGDAEPVEEPGEHLGLVGEVAEPAARPDVRAGAGLDRGTGSAATTPGRTRAARATHLAGSRTMTRASCTAPVTSRSGRPPAGGRLSYGE